MVEQFLRLLSLSWESGQGLVVAVVHVAEHSSSAWLMSYTLQGTDQKSIAALRLGILSSLYRRKMF